MPAKKSSPATPAFFPAWLGIVRAYNLCDQLLARGLAPLGLRTSEHELLMNLLRHPGSTQQQLGAQLLTAKSVVSTTVSRLQERGLLSREADAQDARVWRLSLTAEGQALALRALAVQNAVVARMGAEVDAAEMAGLEASAARISASLQAALDTDAPS
jgi:DNA-binding MarR family transcriptional regulator